MKYLLTLVCITTLLTFSSAQQSTIDWQFHAPHSFSLPDSLIHFRQVNVLPPYNPADYPTHDPQPAASGLRGFTTVEIGNTYFDLQSNASIGHQLFRDDDGKMYAVWNFAPTIDPYFTSRGTGYNYFNGNLWLPDPTTRIEDQRTGWPNALITFNTGADDQQEFILCHNLDLSLSQLNKRQPPGTGTWTEELNDLQAPDSTGIWWSRIIRGNLDQVFHRYYLHAIALTLPELQGGHKVHGMDGCLLYYRSSDNGLTWDKQKVLIPGLDSTTYARIRPDNYAIDAYQSTLAVVVGGFGNDLSLFVSGDNGLNWTKTTIQKFPIPRFDDQITDTSGDGIPEILDTNDGNVAVLIDNSGTIHVWAGYNQIYNDDTTDHIFSFQPKANGILYWNSNQGATPMKVITGALDLNHDGAITIGNYGFFNTGFASQPSAGIDAGGRIFFSYSAIDELAKDADSKNVRHTYVMGSSNSGQTWSYPYDLASDSAEECIYACLARNNDDNLHLTYQRDFCAGIGVTYNDPDPCNNGELNTIVYVEAPANEVLNNTAVSTPVVPEASVYPNPASDQTQLSLPWSHPMQGILTITDMRGHCLLTHKGMIPPHYNLPLKDLPQGMLIIKVETTSETCVVKLQHIATL